LQPDSLLPQSVLFCESKGQIDVSFFPPNNTSGSGRGAYGSYGASQSFTAAVVSCAQEP